MTGTGTPITTMVEVRKSKKSSSPGTLLEVASPRRTAPTTNRRALKCLKRSRSTTLEAIARTRAFLPRNSSRNRTSRRVSHSLTIRRLVSCSTAPKRSSPSRTLTLRTPQNETPPTSPTKPTNTSKQSAANQSHSNPTTRKSPKRPTASKI